MTEPTEVGRGLPGWTPRVVILVAGLGAVLAQAPGVATGVVLTLAVFTLVTALLPGSPAPLLLIGAVAVVAAVADGSPLRWPVLVAIPLLHLVHLASAIGAVLPVPGRITVGALVTPIRRFLVAQAVAFAVVGITALLPLAQNTALIEVAGLVGTVGLALLAIRLLYRAR